MTVYIICAHSIIVAGQKIDELGHQVSNCLTDAVIAELLLFPKRVAEECYSVDDESSGTAWVRAVSGHLPQEEYTSDDLGWVLDECPRVVDRSIKTWQGNPAVLATAYRIRQVSDKRVIIVSDDTMSSPRKKSLSDCCEELGFECVNFEEFYETLLTRQVQ